MVVKGQSVLKKSVSLKEYEKHYHNLLDNMLEGYAYCKMLFDEEGRPIDWIYIEINNSFEQITGLKNIIGKKVTEVIPGVKELEPELFEKYGRVTLTGNQETFETYFKPLQIWLNISVYCPEKDHFVAIFENISESKMAEIKIKKQYNTLEGIINANNAPIFSVDTNYRYTSFNTIHASLMKQLYGADIEIGKNLLEYQTEFDGFKAKKNIDMALNGETIIVKSYSGDEEHSRLFFEISHNPIKDLNGDVIGVAFFAQDITRRQKVEDELKQSEEKFRSLVDNAGDALFVHDFDGKILDVNKKACDSLGYSSRELLQKNVMDIEQDFLLKNAQKEWLKIKSGESFNLIGHHRCKDGTIFPVDIKFAVTNFNDQRLFMALARDMTERIKAENELKSSLKEKNILLQEIHHRVKNNMQIISSLLNLQTHYVDEEAIDVLIESQNRVKSMALIHEKIYLSNDLTHINFTDYIHSLVESLFNSYRIDKSKIKPVLTVENVDLNMETAIPCGLIISELISNSLKHAFPYEMAGEIYISLKSLENKYELIICDNGIGLKEELDFNNLESLGLLLVNNLIDQIDGDLTINR